MYKHRFICMWMVPRAGRVGEEQHWPTRPCQFPRLGCDFCVKSLRSSYFAESPRTSFRGSYPPEGLGSVAHPSLLVSAPAVRFGVRSLGCGVYCFGDEFDLTESVYQVGSRKSIPAQTRQRILITDIKNKSTNLCRN